MSSKYSDSSDSYAFGRTLEKESSNYKSLFHYDRPPKDLSLHFSFLINLTLTPIETPVFLGTYNGFSLSFPTNFMAVSWFVNNSKKLHAHMLVIYKLSYLCATKLLYFGGKEYTWFVVSKVPSTAPETQ